MHAPPVVDEHVEDAQNENEESSRPFGLEPNGYHGACNEANYGDEYAGNAPFALEDETKEKENEENTSSELEIFPTIVFA